ncbi:MAG: SusC/RagA family TonB-linked outer membrane protein [Bacteroidales bacterium]|jgi:TonB-linked SusC/RagA family outer membrane protein|nr:SusC/RagA family TonB-linked outer membrane protein [Bacteroidales bacterium]
MKMTKLFAACVATFLVMGPGFAYAAATSSEVVADQQQTRITGTVVDAQGVPVPGASVIVKGTANGTMTDGDGVFTISAAVGATLEVSCIGYATVDVPAAAGMKVVLKEDNEFLEESVVTALGIKRERKSLGYAVEDIKAEELMRNKSANAITSLSGKIAGVNVTQSSGAAGAGASIILRGGTSGSESRDNQPLFVVDGIIYDNSSQVIGNTAFDGSGSAYTTSSNRVMDINPEDIENMSILKGPAASALYGSRAANGVILITTKKGKDGAVEVNFNSKFITSWARTLPAVQNQYKRGFIEEVTDDNGKLTNSFQNDKAYTSWGEKYNGPWYDNAKNFFRTAGTWDNNLSVSGGTQNSNFFLSASNYAQKGIVPGTGYNKTTFRFNGEQKFLKIFTASANVAYSIANTDRTLTSGGLYNSSGTGTLNAVYTWAPSDDMTIWANADGSRYKLPGVGDQLDPWDEKNNPYWIINKDHYYDKTERFTGAINLRADITKWWFINYRLGVDTYNQTNSSRVAANGVVKQVWQKGMMSDNMLKYTYLSHNVMSNMNAKLGDFSGNLMLGMQTDDITTDRNYKMAWNFEVPEFFSYANATDNNRKFAHSATKKRLIGVFGEIRLDWRNTIFLSATGRNDWTSTLPVANRSYFYPSVSGAIVFTQFLQDQGWMSDDILTFGKIRASWAKVGKDTGAYETNTQLWPVGSYLLGKTGVGATWTRGNPELLPEMSKSSEVGVELHFFKHRLNFDLAYYTNDSYNQILSPRGPQSTGYIFCSINAGNVYNRGLELSISGTPIETKDFVWESSLNAAGNRGTMSGLPSGMEIMYVTDVQYGGARAASVSGGNFMAITGTKWTRVTSNDDVNYGSKEGQLVIDKNGFPVSDGVYSYQIGNREATFTGGWNNTLSYKGFTFNMLWEFRVGGDVFNGTKMAMTTAGTSQFSADVRNQSLTISGVQKIGEDEKKNPIYGDVESHTWEPDKVYTFNGKEMTGYNIIKNYYTGAYNTEVANWITKVNSLRLRTLSLTYEFPKALLQKTRVIKRASITASANNVLLFTNYDGDPEVAASGAGSGGSSSVGFDYLGTPATSSFTFGINLSF